LRRMSVFAVAFVATSSVFDAPLVAEDVFRLTFEVDLIQIERNCLRELGASGTGSDRVIALNDVEAFFLRQVVAENNGDKGVYARSKAMFPDSKPVKFTNRGASDAVKRATVRKDAWPDLRPFAFQISPTVLSENTLTLKLEFKSAGRRQTRGPVKAAHGATILILLDSQSDVYHAVLVTPRIVKPDREKRQPTSSEGGSGEPAASKPTHLLTYSPSSRGFRSSSTSGSADVGGLPKATCSRSDFGSKIIVCSVWSP
jgi:hypothetical protein